MKMLKIMSVLIVLAGVILSWAGLAKPV